ncbi:TolC family protein [Flavobacterium sp. SUN046]|uniref:TolC family protein n=1 Tax=Flavobacterium sp. SUN046 TaxID=3002440 RepID=UPI002DBD848F|nr:TolC family protein [Flavobacterium sp. SUN046]MEC4048300.1 TolC family protein [Flavobacterium sp. SUN046]
MTSNKIIIALLLLFIFSVSKANAQDVLSLEDAVAITLKNNYDIKIAKNSLKINETNNSIGNSGMLPNISATIQENKTTANTTQVQSDGTQKTLNGAKNLGFSYGVGLDWTVFDGFKMFAKREQLQVLEKQGAAQLKMAIISKISDVYTAYYDLVQQQQQITALDSAIVISNQRLTLAQNRYTIGKASKLEVLNAQVDLNTDRSSLLQQKQMLKTSKIRLNEIMARAVATEFVVANSITVDEQLKIDELKSLAEKQNPQLESQILAKNIAELQLKQVKAGRYPTIKVNSGYNYTHSEASLGFVTQSTGKGITYGFSAALPIFNGGLQNRNEKIAKLQLDTTSQTLEQQKLSLQSQLASAFESYSINKELIKVEESNLAIARQNMDITLAKFKIGTLTAIDFRTAQQNLLNAKVRYSNAQYQAKLYEISLKELSGSLSF